MARFRRRDDGNAQRPSARTRSGEPPGCRRCSESAVENSCKVFFPVAFVAVLVALALTGTISARLGGSDVRRAVLRVVVGGALGLAFTYGVGHLFGTAIG